MPPECEEIEDRIMQEKISCIDGRIKDHLRFAATSSLCDRRAMVNKLWCHDLVKKWFNGTQEPPRARFFTEPVTERYVATWFLVYRWLIFASWLVVIVCAFLEVGSLEPVRIYEKWPIYLTNWGIMLGVAQAFFGVFLTTRRWKQEKSSDFDPASIPLGSIERIYWFLFVVASNTAICVTITYWCAIYDPKMHNMDAVNIMQHLCNSILMLVDFCVTNTPYRLRSIWWCLMIVTFYVAFSLIYYLVGGLDRFGSHHIYKVLDWKKPLQTTLFCFGEAVFVSVIHLAFCFLERVKYRVYTKVSKKSFEPSQFPGSVKQAGVV